MGKHKIFVDGEDEQPVPKKPKLSMGTQSEKGADLIADPEDLRKLLLFQQQDAREFRINVQELRDFLESISNTDDLLARSQKCAILLEFLRSNTPRDDDNETPSGVPSLIQAWSFAAHTKGGIDALLSGIPAVITLLLKIISPLIEFRDVGVRLCKSLLHKDQIKLFNKGITAYKAREHLVAPCLRLLTEILAFDGGSCARSLYVQRDVTFNRLDMFLGMRQYHDDKPFLRSTAIPYLLANLRFQERNVKSEVVALPRLIRVLFHDIKEDPPHVIIQILKVVRESIVANDAIPRSTKSRLLTDTTLIQIASVYQSYDKSDSGEAESSAAETAHAFLLYVCTAFDQGILMKQNGWYPPSSEQTKMGAGFQDSSSKSHSTEDADTPYSERLPVRNTTLASFLQSLRPYGNVRDKELALAIFQAAPELVADYFLRKKSFSFDPKLTATWIGFSSFLFSVIQQDVPSHGRHLDHLAQQPPPISVVLESIIPQPLSQKSMTKCLNQSSELIKFFVMRLLITAFKKLQRVLSIWSSENSGVTWKHAAESLKSQFCQRCPQMRHVIMAFHNCLNTESMLKQATSRLLSLYYKIAPSIALQETLDISVMLTNELCTIHSKDCSGSQLDMASLQVIDLLEIACRAPDMKWWQKPETMALSPFSSILKVHVLADDTSASLIGQLLQSVVSEHHILQKVTKVPSFLALLSSLKKDHGFKASDSTWEFLDNCILRLVRKPIKYFGDIEEYNSVSADDSDENKRPIISLLVMAVVEQWPFIVRDYERVDLLNAASWVARYLKYSQDIGEDSSVLSLVQDRLNSSSEGKLDISVFKSASKQSTLITPSLQENSQRSNPEFRDGMARARLSSVSGEVGLDNLASTLEHTLKPPLEAEDHPGLNRWSRKDVAEGIEDDSVSDLLVCLCSEHEEIRRQALINLKLLMSKLQLSGYSEWKQVYLLLGEAVESSCDIIQDRPLPSFVAVLAIRAIPILNHPLHFMYSKLNGFLNRSPSWEISRLPSYWIDKIVLNLPEIDNARYQEFGWLLDTLIEGLRTPEDVNMYRRCAVFERVMAPLRKSPSLPKFYSEKVYHLLYRCALIGGSTTLVTRCSSLAWIRDRAARKGPSNVLLKCLDSKIRATCDFKHVSEWSNGEIRLGLDRSYPNSALID